MDRRSGDGFVGAIVLVCASALALFALYITAGWNIDLENLAKGSENTSRVEVFENRRCTGSTVRDITAIIDESSSGDAKRQNALFRRILWMGNSQLHYINQYRENDHLAPYWLRIASGSPDTIEPLGFSLPNINFQEMLVLSRYTLMRLPVNLLILELVFDDLREDGLRSDFDVMLGLPERKELEKSSAVAARIVQRFSGAAGVGEASEGRDALSGTVQRSVEQWLNKTLAEKWRLWASRPRMEGNVYFAFYSIRNRVLGIKPTTVRRMIRVRYDLNMDALKDILADARRRHVSVLLYIAPIRQDKKMPYDPVEYNRWKNEISCLANRFEARLVNLEALVPGDMWGSCVGNEIDFMHFQGPGHRLVAEALLPHVESLTGVREKKGNVF